MGYLGGTTGDHAVDSSDDWQVAGRVFYEQESLHRTGYYYAYFHAGVRHSSTFIANLC